MNEMDRVIRQAAVVAALAKKQPGIGRTALMKYMYLLQTVKNMPLGFDFKIYAYGPYDAAVLSRVSTAVRWGAVTERSVEYSTGTKHELHPYEETDSMLSRDEAFFIQHDKDLEWVVSTFKDYTAAGMELIGTMVFAEREAVESKEKRTKSELVDIVLKIKPRFSRDQADGIYDALVEMKALKAV